MDTTISLVQDCFNKVLFDVEFSVPADAPVVEHMRAIKSQLFARGKQNIHCILSCGDALNRNIVGVVEDMMTYVFPNHASWEFVVCILGLIEEGVNKEFEAAKQNGKEAHYYLHYQENCTKPICKLLAPVGDWVIDNGGWKRFLELECRLPQKHWIAALFGL